MDNKIENNIVINENDLGILYPDLGSGVEGTVYKYNNTKVIKIFNKDETSLDTIIDRVKYLINIKVKNVVFPEQLVCNSKNEVIGYSMKSTLSLAAAAAICLTSALLAPKSFSQDSKVSRAAVALRLANTA